MHRLARIAFSAAAALALASTAAFAQSSGNVATDEQPTTCEIATTSASLSNTYTCVNPATGASVPCPSFGSSTPLLQAPIQVSAGAGNAIVVTPSLDTGLYTNSNVSGAGTLTGNDGEETGIMVTVEVCNSANVCAPAQPEVKSGSGVSGVMYDQRFQDLNVNNIQCSVGTKCNIQLVQNTLSAHSFSFYYPVPAQDTYTVKVFATLVNAPSNMPGETDACVGPASLTAVQVKAFSQN